MSTSRDWIDELPQEELEFMRRFVLASGSLKELAKKYGISYPTVRLRLNRLIEMVENLSKSEPLSPLEKELQLLTVRGDISRAIAQKILGAHQETLTHEREN